MARELGASMNAAAPDEVLPGEQQAGRSREGIGGSVTRLNLDGTVLVTGRGAASSREAVFDGVFLIHPASGEMDLVDRSPRRGSLRLRI